MVGRVLVVVAVLLMAPATARAVTIEDIVALSKAGVADSVLIALIDADQTVFDLTPQQIVDLKQAGVPDSVVVRMVLTSRDFQGRAPRQDAPTLVIIGEKPPEPEPLPPPSFTVITPLFIPSVPVYRARAPERRTSPPEPKEPERDRDRDRDRDRGSKNDGHVDSFGHRSVCVRGGWVGWCGS